MTDCQPRYELASDNTSGVCPEAWDAWEAANPGVVPSYGDDPWTGQVSDRIRELFETDCEVFFVFNGTAANSLALATACQPYHSVVTHRHAHIETDECNGPAFFSGGVKLLLVDGPDAKVTPEAIEHTARRRSDIHYPKPKAVSVTQTTELGGVYSLDELRQIGETKARLGLKLHMDGARFANAVAALDVRPSDMTWKAGVDVLCFGGTKNGLAVGDCVVFFDRRLANDFAYRCKQAGQLASKMRYLSAPWLGLLQNDVWLKNARHANRTARQLAERLTAMPGVSLVNEVQANTIFVSFPPGAADQLRQRGWVFYDFIGAGGSRLMCSWNTSEEVIDDFCHDVEHCLPLR